MTSTRRVDKVTDGAVSAEATTGRIENLFERAPAKTFFHLRDVLEAMMRSHRKAWIARTKIKFSGIKLKPFGKRDDGDDRAFFYEMYPKGRSAPKTGPVDLADIGAVAFSRSEAALGMETGGTYRPKSSRYMSIPIGFALNRAGKTKRGFASMGSFLKSNPVNRDTVVYASRGGQPIIYIIEKLGGLRRDGSRVVKKKVRHVPIFQLVESVTKPARLFFLDTWDDKEADRAEKLDERLGRIVSELEGGK